MTTSTTPAEKKPGSKLKKAIITVGAAAFWLLLWQFASIAINNELLLASPLDTLQKLAALAATQDFWLAIITSFERIIMGFFCALLVGALFAYFSYKNGVVKALFHPFFMAIKAVPVASFVILALVWFSSKYLSMFISFLMVLPVVYLNIYHGISCADEKLLEMAHVFRVSGLKKLRYIYLPALMPHFVSACSLSLGLCWKAGVAAEVIGLPRGTIGEGMYQSKIFLDTAELFAWTVVIVTISFAFEKLFLYVVRRLGDAMLSHGRKG